MEAKIKENKEKSKKPVQQSAPVITNEMIQQIDEQII